MKLLIMHVIIENYVILVCGQYFNCMAKVDKSTDKMAPEKTCNRPDSRIAPKRDLDSCSLVSRYERARFGSDDNYDEKSKPSNCGNVM